MKRILGIDFGDKRIGLAVYDPQARLAVPLCTVRRNSDSQAIREILEISRQHEIGRLVMGDPLNLDGSRGPASVRARSFARKLAAASGLGVDMANETLTSVEAEEKLRQAGIDPRRHPEKVDAMAAQILLQQYLSEPSARHDE